MLGPFCRGTFKGDVSTNLSLFWVQVLPSLAGRRHPWPAICFSIQKLPKVITLSNLACDIGVANRQVSCKGQVFPRGWLKGAPCKNLGRSVRVELKRKMCFELVPSAHNQPESQCSHRWLQNASNEVDHGKKRTQKSQKTQACELETPIPMHLKLSKKSPTPILPCEEVAIFTIKAQLLWDIHPSRTWRHVVLTLLVVLDDLHDTSPHSQLPMSGG